MANFALSVSEDLHTQLAGCIADSDGWLAFDAFMHHALYAPGCGYYTNGAQKFGSLPSSGSDFVTAPELSPWFGQCVGVQIAQALHASGTRTVYEFGAGTGALAWQICTYLASVGLVLERYCIVEVSSELRQRQQTRLAVFADCVQWLDALPAQMQGVVLGNEVLDAMPVKLLARSHGQWHERGVMVQAGRFVWQDRPTDLRPPLEIAGPHDYLTEIHPQAEGFVRTIAECLSHGAVFLIDYGFPEAEYYHPQRHMGTLMCHYQHQADPDPLDKVGLKDITAHVNFTGVALAGQDAGLDVLGYCTQGRFLMNCGLLSKMEQIKPLERAVVAKLVNEHEMGELFKVIAFGKGVDFAPLGFEVGDRSHTL
jgi:SAM-dependent MidA family methyltransferase